MRHTGVETVGGLDQKPFAYTTVTAYDFKKWMLNMIRQRVACTDKGRYDAGNPGIDE